MTTDVKAAVVASPLSPRIGVEVSGVDFSLPLTPAVAKLLVELLDAHSLLLFRDVDVGDRDAVHVECDRLIA
jgi:alpha-ketoglutarate-dependent taurine dioxygenase